MEKYWIAENDAERARLIDLVNRLNNEELLTPMPAGWTVASVLMHMAFWDARVMALLDKWATPGASPSPADREANEIDWANDATKVIFLAMPPRFAADLAVRIAENCDIQVAAISDELLAQIETAGSVMNPNRAQHRREHLGEIEAALAIAKV